MGSYTNIENLHVGGGFILFVREVNGETGRVRLCILYARGRVVEKGSLESWPEIALLAPACVSWSAEPACGALIMSCR